MFRKIYQFIHNNKATAPEESSKKQISALESLPAPIFLNVINYLSLKDTLQLSTTNKSIHSKVMQAPLNNYFIKDAETNALRHATFDEFQRDIKILKAGEEQARVQANEIIKQLERDKSFFRCARECSICG